MASNGDTHELKATMDKLSLDGGAKYLPPHRKLASVPRPPPPTPATSSANGADQVTPTNGQSAAAPTFENRQGIRSAPAVDAKRSYPHRKYAADIAAAKPASAVQGGDAAPAKETEVAPAKEAEATPAGGAEVVDSWEEEASDAELEKAAATKSEADDVPGPSPESAPQPTPPAPVPGSTTRAPVDFANAPHRRFAKTPAAPPPTPSSPSNALQSPRPSPARTSTPPDRRPEKTMAVANRLIAGALGVKAPRRTEEQRTYDKAVREQERKRRDAERDAKKKAEEEAARAKAAIWDD